MTRLKDGIAVVTGGGRGIGKAIAHRFATEGAKVAILEVDEAAGQRTVADLRAAGADAIEIAVDVSDRQAMTEAMSSVARQLGTPGILVNNAGVALCDDPMTLSEEDWRRTFAVDVDGVWHGIRAALPYMLERGEGSIVTIASVHSFKIVPNYFPYPVAKHAVIGLTRAIAVEYAARNITCNAVCPGAIETELNCEIWAAASDPVAERRRWQNIHPVKRIGRPEEVASAALFLASAEARFITGECLMIDGGRSVVYHD